MERYLLFDSGCSLCNTLAQDIECESKGWLKARSLRDPELHTQLDRVSPGWHWEPMLMEVRGDQTRIFAGIQLRWKLLSGLGPRRMWNVVQVISRATVSTTEVDLARRRLFKRGAALLGGLALGLGWGQFGNQQAHAASPPSPYGLKQLATEQLQQLKHASPVQAVNNAFGTPNWNVAFTFQKGPHQQGYVIQALPSTMQAGAKATVLVVDSGISMTIVGQMALTGSQALEIQWFHPDGQILATTIHNLHTGTVITAKPGVVPNFNTNCFWGCLGYAVSQYCANSCLLCALGYFLSCAFCTSCAGISGAYCAWVCR